MATVQETSLGDYLVQMRHLTAAQHAEVELLVSQSGARLTDAVVKLGFMTAAEVRRALAEYHDLLSFDIGNIHVPQAVVELVPESVARENVVFPVAFKRRILFLLVSEPNNGELIQKLQFILNCDIEPIWEAHETIIETINRHYGAADTESVDSYLIEFTDTAITFAPPPQPEPTERKRYGSAPGSAARPAAAPPAPAVVVAPATAPPVGAPGPAEEDDDFACAETADGVPAPRPAKLATGAWRAPGAAKPVQRQATVRHYCRMNPQRLFPLLVVLSRRQILEVAKRHVAQAASGPFEVALGSQVEVEPILPGCACYPPRETVAIREGEASTTFWVAPQVLGAVMQARVVVRQNGAVLAEVPLQIRVVKQGLTVFLGLMSLVLPLVLAVLKQFRLDFESQLRDGFGLYSQLLDLAVQTVSPEWLAGILVIATCTAYLWLRPRRRDVFWDIATVDNGADTAIATPLPVSDPPSSKPAVENTQDDFFREADEHYHRGEYQKALLHYENGLQLGIAHHAIYSSAALAAHHAGDTQKAFEILYQASLVLHPAQIPGVLWFNLGCFATRLGRFADAVRFLNRAVDAGHGDAAKYSSDPDLAPLRWRADFKRLLASLQG